VNVLKNLNRLIKYFLYHFLLDQMLLLVFILLYNYSIYSSFLDSEIVRPIADSTISSLKTYETRILSTELDRLLDEVNKVDLCFQIYLLIIFRLLTKKLKIIQYQLIEFYHHYHIRIIVYNIFLHIAQQIILIKSIDNV
jgi:hypothetical protein